jgi:hypothetical protein
MITSIVPLKAILFQTLFLLVAIAVESSFLYEFLKYPRKTSLDYAIAMNLFATSISWMLFFALLPLIHESIQTELMDFIFLNQLSNPFQILITFLILVVFMSGLSLKFLMFIILQKLEKLSLEPTTDLYEKSKPIFKKKLKPKIKNRVIIWGHSCSHAIILLILAIVTWNQ